MRNRKVLVLTTDARLAAGCVDAFAPSFEPFIVEDGETALLRAAKLPFDGLVIDLDIPNSDMFNVVTALKGHGPTRDIAIVAVASSKSDDLVELAREHGCDHVSHRESGGGMAVRMLERIVERRLARAA
jgi:PleD family two-component response regulator